MAVAGRDRIIAFVGEYRFLSNFYLLPHEYLEWQSTDFYSVEHAYQASKAADVEVFRIFGVGFCALCHNHSEDHRLSMCPVEWAMMTGDPCKWSAVQKFKRMTPGDAKRLGRKIPIRPDWDSVKLAVMLDLLRLKFKQYELQAELLATGDAELVEGNDWGDKFWGVDYRVGGNGRGQNHLGKLLMQVREELRAQ